MIDASLTLLDFQALLKLQAVDTTIDQLTAKRSALPAHADIAAVQVEATQLRPKMQEAAIERDALRSKQDELENEVATTAKRIADINGRLYDSNSKVGPSDALAMTQEVRHLKERQTSFEDQELEIMEQLEAAEAVVAPFEAQAQALAVKMQQAQADVVSGQREIDEELVVLHTTRANAVSNVPASLISEYEKLRSRLGGQVVVPLVGNTCGGCHVSMAVTEVTAIKKQPESALIHCEECDRLLVRSA